MYSEARTMTYTEKFSAKIERLKTEINSADSIIIGAGAGLSTAAGFTYSGERFENYFSDFIAKYGFRNMYEGGFYPFESLDEYWAYWSRYIYINRYMDVDNGTYKRLFQLVRDKDYYVLTTNVDHQFQKAGFDKERLFYTQGDYGLFQCSRPCCKETWDNEDSVIAMMDSQENMRIPTELIPRCPRCGKPLTMNLRADDKFVEDSGWHKAGQRYEKYLRSHVDQNILFLELGVGMNTPGIIKFPFWRMTFQNPNAFYACLNFGESYAPKEIKERSVCIDADISDLLTNM